MKTKPQKDIILSTRVEPALADKVFAVAKSKQRSVSWVIREWIAWIVGGMPGTKKERK